MKRGYQNDAKLKSQRILYRQDIHYERVQEVGMDRRKKEQRAKRFDIIVKHNISRTSGIEMPGGITIPIKYITPDGMIVLDNHDRIDPIALYAHEA